LTNGQIVNLAAEIIAVETRYARREASATRLADLIIAAGTPE
jgi:hypothetical protein